eukprot:3426496-Pyramimonas_sp.AAC.1
MCGEWWGPGSQTGGPPALPTGPYSALPAVSSSLLGGQRQAAVSSDGPAHLYCIIGRSRSSLPYHRTVQLVSTVSSDSRRRQAARQSGRSVSSDGPTRLYRTIGQSSSPLPYHLTVQVVSTDHRTVQLVFTVSSDARTGSEAVRGSCLHWYTPLVRHAPRCRAYDPAAVARACAAPAVIGSHF